MYLLVNCLFGLSFFLLLLPQAVFSEDSTTHAKSIFSRQFEQDPGKYDYQRDPDYYYYYDNRQGREEEWDYGHHRYHHHSDRPRGDRPYYYWDKGGLYLHWPSQEDQNRGGGAPGK